MAPPFISWVLVLAGASSRSGAAAGAAVETASAAAGLSKGTCGGTCGLASACCVFSTGAGVLAFITNHGYLDNPTFRGMRQQLMETFDEIYVNAGTRGLQVILAPADVCRAADALFADLV